MENGATLYKSWSDIRMTSLKTLLSVRNHSFLNQHCSAKDKGDKYSLLKNEEDPRLTMFDKPLPCFGCGVGWFCLLLGFGCPLLWYFAAVLYFSSYYHKDPRERSGLAACAIAAAVCTIACIITVIAVLV